MGDWVPKEEWEAHQAEQRNKPPVKIPFIIPQDVKKILNMTTERDIIENFLTCICHGVKNLSGISNSIVKLRCTGCGMEYGYPEDHYYFNFKKTPEPPEPPAPTPSTCTCRKCHVPIEPAQAKSSWGFAGKELCGACMGDELA